jgi:hypothetical protein
VRQVFVSRAQGGRTDRVPRLRRLHRDGGVACGAKSMSVTSGGTASARVFPAVAATGASTTAWTKGDLVVVCVAVKATSFTRFVRCPTAASSSPRPSCRSRTDGAHAVNFTGDTDPSGQNWSWCQSA